MSCFFDTNVLVYLFDGTEPVKQALAQDLVGAHMASRELVISTQVLQELYVTLTRKKHLDAADALEIASTFAQERVVPASVEMVLAGLSLSEQRRLSAWDALIVQAALQADCHTLYSEDFQSGARFDEMVVVNPFALQVQEPSAPYAGKRR